MWVYMLKAQIAQKDREIADLKNQLEKMNVTPSETTAAVEDQSVDQKLKERLISTKEDALTLKALLLKLTDGK